MAFGLSASATLPIRNFDVNGVVEKVVPATEAEKKDGALVTVFVRGRADGIRVTTDTPVHRQEGKLVPVADAADTRAEMRVSVWLKDWGPVAEGVLLFP